MKTAAQIGKAIFRFAVGMFVRRLLISATVAAFISICCPVRSGTPKDPEYDAYQKRFAAFKQRNLPRVGTVVTAHGVVQGGKPGMFVPFDGGEIYIQVTREADVRKDNEIADRFFGRSVSVTGILQYFPATSPPPGIEGPVQLAPEHFFFDVAHVTITEEVPR